MKSLINQRLQGVCTDLKLPFNHNLQCVLNTIYRGFSCPYSMLWLPYALSAKTLYTNDIHHTQRRTVSIFGHVLRSFQLAHRKCMALSLALILNTSCASGYNDVHVYSCSTSLKASFNALNASKMPNCFCFVFCVQYHFSPSMYAVLNLFTCCLLSPTCSPVRSSDQPSA